MKHKLMISAVIASLGLSACGGEKEIVYLPATEPPVKVTEAPTTTRPVPKTTDAPIAVAPSDLQYSESDAAMFITGVYSEYDYPIFVSDEEILLAGITTCEFMRGGGTVNGLVEMIGNASDWSETKAEFIIVVASAAVAYLCPDQSYKFE